MTLVRVQKILVEAGYGSRRDCDAMVLEGKVTVNGKIAVAGQKADLEKDHIKVSGKLILRKPVIKAHFLFYKPRAVLMTHRDPQNRPTFIEYLPSGVGRIVPVGRMDFLMEGIVILTTDGTLAESIVKSDKIIRVYEVKVKGHPEAVLIEGLKKPMRIEGSLVSPINVYVSAQGKSKSKIEIAIKGTGGTDLKLFFERRGLLVDRIICRQFGHLSLGEMEPGQLRPLKQTQLEALVKQPELGLKALEKRSAGIVESMEKRNQLT